MNVWDGSWTLYWSSNQVCAVQAYGYQGRIEEGSEKLLQ